MKRPTQLFDHTGRPVCLGPEFKRGGEGAVFEVSGQPDVLAKIYHKLPSPEKAEKLRCMVKTASADILSAVAWPTATLHEVAGGKVSGILMRRVVGYREIHTLYSPAHRNQTFPRADWAFLIRVARNCAITFETLHRHGHVVGDVNQSNVLVSNQATVTLIDCDSFQVSDGLRAFRCEVGVPLFTPPELHGRNFRDIQRTSTHDCFGLAVLIFHLLFMGRHPFSGRFLGKGDLPLERAIEEARFAFSKNAASRQMSAPPNCPTLNLVPANLANLFERAFGEEAKNGRGRPSAHDWDAALHELEGQLKHCGADLGHRYSRHLSSCPWCELIRIGAPNFFVSVLIVTSTQGQTAAFQLEAFWAEVERVLPPPSLHSRPTIPTNSISPTPLPPSAIPGPRPPIQQSVIQTTVGWIAVAAVVLTLPESTRLFGINIFGAFSIWWCICKWMSLKQFEVENLPWVRARYELTREHSRREHILRKTTAEIDDAERRILDLIAQAAKAFDKCKTDLLEAKSKFVELETTLQAEKARLENAKRDFQLHQFLERHFIRDAKLDGIGPTRLAQLESYGIETAADISDAALYRVPGFGPKLCGTVRAFRWSIEARFHFDPKAAIPASEIAALNSRFAAARRDHEVRLLAGLRALREINPKVQAKLEPLNLSVQGFAIRLIQAEADASVSRKAISSSDTHNLESWFPRNSLFVLALCIGFFCYLAEKTSTDSATKRNVEIAAEKKAIEVAEVKRQADEEIAAKKQADEKAAAIKKTIEEKAAVEKKADDDAAAKQAAEEKAATNAKQRIAEAGALRLRGLEQLTAQNYYSAIDDFSKAIELFPTAEAYAGRGVAYFKTSNVGRAEADRIKAGSLLRPVDSTKRPISTERWQLAKSYRRLGNEELSGSNYKESLQHFTFAVSLDDSEQSYQERAEAFLYAKKYHDAIPDCTKVIELNPRNAAAYYLRCLCLRRLRKESEAASDMVFALKLDSSIAERHRDWQKR